MTSRQSARPDRDRTGTVDDLAAGLHRIDGAGYGRYRSLSGTWTGDGFSLEIRRVQPDPFAPPSRLRVVVPPETAGLPEDLRDTDVRRRALGGFLLRALRDALVDTAVTVDAGRQEVLERSAIRIGDDGAVVVGLGVPLPGNGRRVAGRQAARTLTGDLPSAVRAALRWSDVDTGAAGRFVHTVEDACALRGRLAERGLVAFVADGALLPRRSGVDDRPADGAVAFASPESLRVTLDTPHGGPVTGMGVPQGVTVIVGGGYHGKSTLLRALQAGVYDHVPGDGRERAVTRHGAVTIRAEDERAVTRVDVSAFVAHLPDGRPTDDFSTTAASGSTSQAASTVEALEAGADVLLIDEDTAATNLMIRDARMQRLVAAEPLVPFVDRVRPLYERRGVSTVLVTGGSGDYLDKADTVILMDAYRADEITARAHEVAAAAGERTVEHTGFPPVTHRVFDPASVDPQVRGRRRVTARGTARLTFGGDDVDLSAVAQLADPSQVTGVGLALAHAVRTRLLDGSRTLAEVLDGLDRDVVEDGVECLAHGSLSDYALPRRHEVAAALNRLRAARVTDLRPEPDSQC